MENPTLYVSVLERFSEWPELIEQLTQRDATFAEMCADFDELANWLAVHSHDGCTPEPECAANRELLAELEAEILRALRAAERDPPAGSADRSMEGAL
jgi:hypothetical protein